MSTLLRHIYHQDVTKVGLNTSGIVIGPDEVLKKFPFGGLLADEAALKATLSVWSSARH